MFSEGRRLADFWERRACRLDRALRVALASDCVSEEQRSEIVAVLVGKKKIGDKKLLSDPEEKLLAITAGWTVTRGTCFARCSRES